VQTGAPVTIRPLIPTPAQRVSRICAETDVLAAMKVRACDLGDALGLEYYEHGAQPGQGYRNGYCRGRLKTAEGLMEYSALRNEHQEHPG
jgi:transposase-like protein